MAHRSDSSSKSFILTILFSGIGLAISFLFLSGPFSIEKQTHFIKPLPYLERLTFGFKEIVADSLWLRLLQDCEECDRPLVGQQNCTPSWAWLMADKITDLSPHFRMVYASIPLVLSLVIGDQEGAVALSQKGVRFYPNDWPILYRTGYLTLYEKKDKREAAEYFVRAQRNGGPDWLIAFATRLYAEAGDIDRSKDLIETFERTGLDPGLIERMKSHLSNARINR